LAFAQPDVLVPVRENTDVASARRAAVGVAVRAGFNEEAAGAAAVVVTEVCSNLVKHGGGGEFLVRDISFGAAPLIEIVAIDSGRGMADVARCFEDGYSTGGSPGTGLGAIARLSRFYDVYSLAGQGTVLLARLGPDAAPAPASEPPHPHIGFSAVYVPYPGEQVSGDAWSYHSTERKARVVVADGLGHGPFASEAAHAAIEVVSSALLAEPVSLIESANLRLRSTRGAAIGVVDISWDENRATFVGVGNVVAAAVSSDGVKRQMISISGTLGHVMGKPRSYDYTFDPGSLLVIHSDGLSASWSFDKYPGLLGRDVGVIAAILFRDFRRVRDDATVVVFRARGAIL